MLVLNETIPEFRLGNNLFNIDEKISLALYEINEEYNWIMERTNVVLEYGVIHEGVITNIIKALINFFKKVIETLLSIFTGGSSGGGGGGSGGGGSSGGSRSSSPTSKPREIKIKHPDFKNYNRDVLAESMKKINDKLQGIQSYIDSIKEDSSLENIAKIFNNVINSQVHINDEEIETFIKNKDKVEDAIDDYMNTVITDMLRGFGVPINNNDMNVDNLKSIIFDFMIGDMKEFTYSTSDISKINFEIIKDDEERATSKSYISLFKISSNLIISSLEKLEQSLSTSNDNTDKLVGNVVQIFVKIIKKDCDILIILANEIVRAMGVHMNYYKNIMEKLKKA